LSNGSLNKCGLLLLGKQHPPSRTTGLPAGRRGDEEVEDEEVKYPSGNKFGRAPLRVLYIKDGNGLIVATP